MNKTNQVTAIVPRLIPAIDGVGDYGLLVAKQIRQDFGLNTQFIVADPNWSGEDFVEGFPVKQLAKQSSQHLKALLPTEATSKTIIFLHYVGYGYAKRGCPVWLVKGLELWYRANNNRCLVTMFHEVYAYGAVWTSQFWTSPFQRNLFARLAHLSDRCLTSRQVYAEIIQKMSSGKHTKIPVLPVFSNVGEPENPTALSERQRRLVVFGNCGSRSRVYQRSRLGLEKACHELEIKEILDIGPDLNFHITIINGIPITSLGIISAEKISSLLATCIVGFFDYSLEFLEKSGIFAAYCAHRLLPIGTWYEVKSVITLQANQHYWLVDKYPQKMNLAAGQIIADNAHTWYENHKLPVQASTFMHHLASFE
jgi:hypothetical protein